MTFLLRNLKILIPGKNYRKVKFNAATNLIIIGELCLLKVMMSSFKIFNKYISGNKSISIKRVFLKPKKISQSLILTYPSKKRDF